MKIQKDSLQQPSAIDSYGMKRREVLKQMCLLFAGVTVTPLFTSKLVNAQDTDEISQIFTADQLLMLNVVAGLIIPATETPGAIEAEVPVFLDVYVNHFYSSARQETFLAGLDKFNSASQALGGQNFAQCDEATQILVLQELDNGSPENVFFSNTKQLICWAYYTSEIGASEELRYVAIPGDYNACLPFEQVGRSWAI